MGGYTVTLFETIHPGTVDGVVTSGALTRYNNKLFGDPRSSISSETYIKNELGDGVCSDSEVIRKYEN